MGSEVPRPVGAPLPACDCGAEGDRTRGHTTKCRMVRAACGLGSFARAIGKDLEPWQERVLESAARRSHDGTYDGTVALAMSGGLGPSPAAALDPIGRKKRAPRGRAHEARGIRFPSLVEAEVFLEMHRRAAARRGAFVLRHPVFDLWPSWTEGMGAPQRFTPDFLLVAPRDVRALEPEHLEDDLGHLEGGGWAERMLALFDVEVHEAKPPRRPRNATEAQRVQLESRDYVVRLGVWRAAWPTVPFSRWSRVQGRLVEERLPLPGAAAEAAETRTLPTVGPTVGSPAANPGNGEEVR